MTAKASKKGSTGFTQTENNRNKMTWYVETKEGKPIDGSQVDAIRAYA